MTHTARYSLLTMQPDPERIDTLCVGALVLTHTGAWSVLTPGANKLHALGQTQSAQRLAAMVVNLEHLLGDCDSLTDARTQLAHLRSSLSLHPFEGIFAYDTQADYARQIQVIAQESIVMAAPAQSTAPTRQRAAKQLVRAQLRRHFAHMGILAPAGDTSANHKIVPNFQLSPQHGLKAEFAMKNSVWHITETVDFDVANEGIRSKTFEAQAKCLVLKAAQDILGTNTQRYIVVHGSQEAHASASVDLLSTVGRLFMTESHEDITAYLDIMAKAAHASGQLRA